MDSVIFRRLLALAVLVIVLAAPGAGRAAGTNDIDEIKREVAYSALDGDWAGVLVASGPLLEGSAGLYGPVVAEALLRTGERERAIEVLDGEGGEIGRILRAALDGGEVSSDGLEEPVVGAGLVFVELNASEYDLALGVFPRSAGRMVLKKALYGVLPSATVRELEAFEAVVLPEARRYFLAGELIYRSGGKAVGMALVDVGRIKAALAPGDAPEKRMRVGVMTRSGGEAGRSGLVEALEGKGHLVEDLGAGEFYSARHRAGSVAAVIEISEETTVADEPFKDRFRKVECRLFATIYGSATGDILGRVEDRSAVVHLDAASGREAALKRCYAGMAERLSAALSGVEKTAGLAPAGTAPLVVDIATGKLFANGYKRYAEEPAGTLTLRNTSKRPASGVEASFFIKEYMDFPLVVKTSVVEPGATLPVDLKPVFNSRILDITEDTVLLSELRVRYNHMGSGMESTATHPVYVHERHALVWDDPGKVAAFVTSKDPVVIDFATYALIGYPAPRVTDNLFMAAVLFEAAGAAGVGYVQDPNSPYEAASTLDGVVDYLQFPRETLARKAGDCDDLTALYSSLLESVGIRTAVVDAPGHLYLLFDTGVEASSTERFAFPEGSYTVRDSTVWLPVETTLIGATYLRAWGTGAGEFASEGESLRVFDVRDAWRTNTPPTLAPLPNSGEEGAAALAVRREAIEKEFPGSLAALEEEWVQNLISGAGKDDEGLGDLLLLLGKRGFLSHATVIGERLVAGTPTATNLNNLANVYYLKGDPAKAAETYLKSIELEAEDAGVWLNLARARFKAGNGEGAKEAFKRAVGIDPAAAEADRELARALGR